MYLPTMPAILRYLFVSKDVSRHEARKGVNYERTEPKVTSSNASFKAVFLGFWKRFWGATCVSIEIGLGSMVIL